MPIPTDRKIFEKIYCGYREQFDQQCKTRSTSTEASYISIDIEELSKQLGESKDVLFGRLYYHLNQRYRYQQQGGAWVHLFAIEVGGHRHCINFPLLTAILAGVRQEHSRATWALGISICSMALSLLKLFGFVAG